MTLILPCTELSRTGPSSRKGCCVQRELPSSGKKSLCEIPEKCVQNRVKTYKRGVAGGCRGTRGHITLGSADCARLCLGDSGSQLRFLSISNTVQLPVENTILAIINWKDRRFIYCVVNSFSVE